MAGLEKSDFNAALGAALKSLAAFEKFSAEVETFLEQKGYAESIRAHVLDHLIRKRLLDDARCAELAVRRLNEKGAGPEKIRTTLERRGASAETVETAMAGINSSPDQLQQILTKKFRTPVTREKAARFLYSRGFSQEEIEAALDLWSGRASQC